MLVLKSFRILIGLSLLFFTAQAQVRYEAEVGAFAATAGTTPFWQRSNTYGTIPLENPFAYMRVGLSQEYDSTRRSQGKAKSWAWAYGISLHLNQGKQTQILLPEAYTKIRWKALEAYIGRRKEIMGLVDSSLSSGSYIWSGNALPMPKIQISIPNYVSVLGHGLLAIKGNFAHAWFGKQKYVEGYYLHQKSLYGRIGREHAPFQFFAGINHQVQWGGRQVNNPENEFAKGWYAYLYSFLPLKYVSTKAVNQLTIGDLENRVGNQLGSLDIAFKIKTSQKSIFIYRQNIYEQGGALLRLANIQDGLTGLSIENNKPKNSLFVKKILFEYFYSKNQGTNPILFTRQIGWELENYFTHFQYQDGWSYQSKTIGTPFITNTNETLAVFPENNQFINNNRIEAFYLGIDLVLNPNTFLVLRNSFSLNSGKRFLDFYETYQQFSGNVKLNHLLPHSRYISLQVGYDKGKIYPNNLGISIAFKKEWL